MFSIFLLGIAFAHGALVIYTDGSGDSLSVAYNAVRNGLPSNSSGESGILNCPNGGVSGRSFASELDSTACPNVPSDLVTSFTEKQNCAGSAGRNMAARNTAVSGATMYSSFANQAVTMANNLASVTQPGIRQVLVFMGHNDVCNGEINKSLSTCNNTDMDQSNYCRVSTQAFEREFRSGLDKLIPSVNVTISILAPARVAQLCRVGSLNMCQMALTAPLPNNCNNAWRARGILGSNGICASLTNDCSDQRVVDAYNSEKAYVDILQKTSAEYESIPVGSQSKTYTWNGKTVGGATKANGVRFLYSNAIWMSQLTPADVSCCDCFHASTKGQQRLADAAFSGVTCSPANPCCTDSSTPLENGKCTTTVQTSGFYPGVQLP